MTSPPTIGIVSPGAMGSALGGAWQRGGARVVDTVAGRSERTRALVFEQAARSELARLTPEQAAGQHDLAAVLAALATGSPSTDPE
ncbi:MAG: hypothetical protein ACR2P2_14065 [Nakamurella sp.]